MQLRPRAQRTDLPQHGPTLHPLAVPQCPLPKCSFRLAALSHLPFACFTFHFLFVSFSLRLFVCLCAGQNDFTPTCCLLLLPLPLPRRHKHMQNVIFCPLIWAASDKRVPASTHPCNLCPVRRSAVNIIKSNACNLISDSSLPVCMSTIFMSC